jgi:DNA-binding XRE family transcriptional regulator
MENKVKELRTKLGLSLWDLASKVDASPQQIQRIENGKQAAPVCLANAICEALGRPLNWVFPGSKKVLDKLLAERSSSRYVPRGTFAELRQKGIEADTRRYTFKVLLRGHQDPMFFNISAATNAELFKAVQREAALGDELPFIVFDSDDSTVAINLSSLIFCHFLWDANIGTIVSEKPSQDDEASADALKYHVKFFLNENPEPLMFVVDPETGNAETGELGDFGSIFCMLDNTCLPSQRLHFEDEDGEDAFIRAGDIAMLQVPLWIVDEYEREAVDGPDDDDDNT